MTDSANSSGPGRRAVRDMVALAALPAVWHGGDERRIAETLADALLGTLDLDFVHLSLRPAADPDGLQVGRTARGAMTDGQARELGQTLAPFLHPGRYGTSQSIPDPVGGGPGTTTHITTL